LEFHIVPNIKPKANAVLIAFINMSSDKDKNEMEKNDELTGKLVGKQQIYGFPFKN